MRKTKAGRRSDASYVGVQWACDACGAEWEITDFDHRLVPDSWLQTLKYMVNLNKLQKSQFVVAVSGKDGVKSLVTKCADCGTQRLVDVKQYPPPLNDDDLFEGEDEIIRRN